MSTKKVDRGLLLFGSVWLVFGLPFLVTGLVTAIQEHRTGQQLREHGQTAAGVVLEKHAGFVHSSTSAAATITFRFATSDGQSIQDSASMEGSAWSRLRKSGPVSVVYLPGSPQTHRVEGQEPQTFLVLIMLLLGGIFSALGGGVIVAAVKSRSRRRPRNPSRNPGFRTEKV